MGNQLLASKVVITEEEPKIGAVPSLPTAICGAVGVTEKGPIGVATLCTSYEEYVSTFGGHIANSDMAACVEAFFQNGGSQLYVTRTVHYTTISNPATQTAVKATITLVDRAGTPLATLRVDGKYHGTYANGMKAKIAAATSGDSDRFDFQLLDANNVVIESFPNVSMLDAHERYVETVINAEPAKGGSRYINVVDLDSVTAAPNDMPAIGSFTLATGNDGLSGLVDADFTGDAAAKNGIRSFDLVDNITLLIVPGRATSAVHNAMITYAEVTRDKQIFAILDPPAGNTAAQIITYVKTTAAIGGLTECAAMYWPRVKISNPKRSVYGTADQVTVPPSGHIAGTMSRVDNARPGGVYDHPAGYDNGKLFGVLDFETTECLDENKLDLVFPERINPLTTQTGAPRFIDGARTLKGTSNFPTIGERRGVSHIERTVKAALQVYRHKNNTPALRATIARTVTQFLLSQMAFGAFRTTDPKTAFFVDFGDALNPPSAKNTITGRIGLATAQPAEFIVLKFSQDQRAAEAALSGK